MDTNTVIVSEAALVGSILKNPAQYRTLREEIGQDDFYDIGFRACWQAFESLDSRNMSIDQVTVGDELERTNSLASVSFAGMSGRPALSAVRDEGRPNGAGSYADNVLDYSAKRQMMERFLRGADWAKNGRRAADIKADMMEAIASIQTPSKRADSHTQTLADALSFAYDRTDKASRGEIKLLHTGYIDLDHLLHGMEGGDLLILAGRPGQGKTALVTSIAYNTLMDNRRVVMFTLEMQNQQIAMRLISMVSGVSYGSQKDGKLKPDEWGEYTNAIQKLEGLKLHLCDLPAIRISDIKKTIRKIEAEHGRVDLVIVDYLQLATPDQEVRTREQEVGRVSRGLKIIAKEFDVPLLACAQLSRGVEQRADKRPVLSDLRESGSIEQDSDVVMFIYRRDEYNAKAPQNITEVIVSKQRNGSPGTVELVFVGAKTRFESASKMQFRD